LYSDGYADQFGGPKGKKFKYKKLNELLLSLSGTALDKQKEILNETFDNWKGGLEQIDDVCVVGIRIN
jgi:serine phosphatase RsbU (regulator of sigma subunit)